VDPHSGRLIEIFGPYDSGKTTIGLAATANAQKQHLRAAYLDIEHKLSNSSVKRAGVDPNKTLFLQVSEATEAVEILLQLALSGEFGLVVVDTLAALTCGWEIEDSPGSFSGKLEALLERSLPRIAAALVRQIRA
jgi:RecA/RadA recombinase